MFIQEFYSNIHSIDTLVPRFATTFRGTSIVVTPDLISEVLRVPRVAHLDYPSCDRLRLFPEISFYLTFVRRLPHGVGSKTPHAQALQKVRDS